MHTLNTVEITKAYRGRKVVDNVSVRVKQGEVVGLLGPNGAGKTTSFYMIVGLITPDSGRVLFDDHDITPLPMYKRAHAASAICRRKRRCSASCRWRTT